MIYCEGRLTLLTKSRKHDWYAKRLSQLVVALAVALEMTWEDAGGATYRREDINAGVEGDETFYFGEHAELMKGARDIDLTEQPPLDLAIEVEVNHSADDATEVWGRLGVPEVWRFDPIAEEFGFWLLRDDGKYAASARSGIFPMLSTADLVAQMRLADQLGSKQWFSGVGTWVGKWSGGDPREAPDAK
jgi:Uma2 family endonuclease